MPRHVEVKPLSEWALTGLALSVCCACKDEVVCRQVVADVLMYLKQLPSSLQCTVASWFACTRIHQGQKVFPYFITNLNGTFLRLRNFEFLDNYEPVSATSIKDLCVEMYKFDSSSYFKANVVTKRVLSFFRTFENLKTYKDYGFCTNEILHLFGQCCPLLEEIHLMLCDEVDDNGIAQLCGFSTIRDIIPLLRTRTKSALRSVCWRLRVVTCNYTLVTDKGFAAILFMFPSMKSVYIVPDINGDHVFGYLHGYDHASYESITQSYRITNLSFHFELEETTMSLISRTCTSLRELNLRCNGMERKDKNILSHALSLPLKHLKLINCSANAVVWFLAKMRTALESLILEELPSSRDSVAFTRTHLQEISISVQSLTHIELNFNSRPPVTPNQPYTTLYITPDFFRNLKFLSFRGTRFHHDDFALIARNCDVLETLQINCSDSHSLTDSVLGTALCHGAFKTLEVFLVHKCSFTVASVMAIMEHCPFIRGIGKLLSWDIQENEYDALCRDMKHHNIDVVLER